MEAYCRENSFAVDPIMFYSFYEGNGWVLGGGNPVRNWKQTLRTWDRRNREAGKRPVLAPENDKYHVELPF